MGIDNTSSMLLVFYYKSNPASTEDTNKYITLSEGRTKGQEKIFPHLDVRKDTVTGTHKSLISYIAWNNISSRRNVKLRSNDILGAASQKANYFNMHIIWAT